MKNKANSFGNLFMLFFLDYVGVGHSIWLSHAYQWIWSDNIFVLTLQWGQWKTQLRMHISDVYPCTFSLIFGSLCTSRPNKYMEHFALKSRSLRWCAWLLYAF